MMLLGRRRKRRPMLFVVALITVSNSLLWTANSFQGRLPCYSRSRRCLHPQQAARPRPSSSSSSSSSLSDASSSIPATSASVFKNETALSILPTVPVLVLESVVADSQPLLGQVPVVVGTTRQRRQGRKRRRLIQALPGRNHNDAAKGKQAEDYDADLDRTILSTAIPSMINNAVVPIVNAVDTFWVGRMGIALALAGQAAANQAFFTLYFLVAYLPTITAPLVASAVGSGDMEEAKARVSESLFLGNLLGLAATLFLVGFPRTGLGMVLPAGSPAMEYAAPYLRFRALSMVPTIIAATGFAAYRGMLDTVTPLKVNLAANLLNLVLDPLLMFGSHPGMGFVGAALATAVSETMAGMTYLKLLMKKKLTSIRLLIRPPSFKSLVPLLQGGLTMLGRQAALNVGFIFAARQAQKMDPSGVAAAAYGIVIQMYSLGIVVHVAMQGTAAALIPATLAHSGKDGARQVADRMFVWGSIIGILLAVSQMVALPWLVPIFSTLPEVQEAVKRPALLASLLHIINGPVFVGEGTMLGLGSYRDLMLITATSTSVLVACLCITPFGKSLDRILLIKMLFCGVQALGVVIHYLQWGPLAVRRRRQKEDERVNSLLATTPI